ncbi:MAG TPA: hypothetical protein VFN35_06760, partial [Ktedonobacteraceae bacterium]|nr:hypothetical protein [Ktedonobacteraceae bacterium]
MNVNGGGPHILLFERDQQLVTLLSSELIQAGYEIHTARTAVEVFDAIARFPVRLVMVNLAQAQAGRREFWVALDAQRRGRGVQVFTFRCTNLGGYGVEDLEDEEGNNLQADLEVEGMYGIVKLMDAVRARVPGSAASSASQRAASAPVANSQFHRSVEMPAPVPQSAPVPQPALPPQPVPIQVVANGQTITSAIPPSPPGSQSLQATLRPQPPQEISNPITPAQPRTGLSTFTDKIRAVIYPSSRSYPPARETTWQTQSPAAPAQNVAQYQNAESQPRQPAVQRYSEADFPTIVNREEMTYQTPMNTQSNGQQAYQGYQNSPQATGKQQAYPIHQNPVQPVAQEESGLDQLSRLLRESQPSQSSILTNGHVQPVSVQPGMTVEQQQLQELRAQIARAAYLDEHSNGAQQPQQQQVNEVSATNGQLRASPIQDMPFEREIEARRTSIGNQQVQENSVPSAMTILQPTQGMPAQQTYISGPLPAAETRTFTTGSSSSTQIRPLPSTQEALPETPTPVSAGLSSQPRPIQEVASQSGIKERNLSGPLSVEENELAEQMRASLQSTLARRPEVKTTDDTLLDIVKSLPPMAPAPQPPQV